LEASPNLDHAPGIQRALITALLCGDSVVCGAILESERGNGYSGYRTEGHLIQALSQLTGEVPRIPAETAQWFARALSGIDFYYFSEELQNQRMMLVSSLPIGERREIEEVIHRSQQQGARYDYDRPYELARLGKLSEAVVDTSDLSGVIQIAAAAGHLVEAERFALKSDDPAVLRAFQVGRCIHQATEGNFAEGKSLAASWKPSLVSRIFGGKGLEPERDRTGLMSSLYAEALRQGELGEAREIERLGLKLSPSHLRQLLVTGSAPKQAAGLLELIDERFSRDLKKVRQPIEHAEYLLDQAEIVRHCGAEAYSRELLRKAAQVLTAVVPTKEGGDYHYGKQLERCATLMMPWGSERELHALTSRFVKFSQSEEVVLLGSGIYELAKAALEARRFDVWRDLYSFNLSESAREGAIHEATERVSSEVAVELLIPLLKELKERAPRDGKTPSNSTLNPIYQQLAHQVAETHPKEAFQLVAQIDEASMRQRTIEQVTERVCVTRGAGECWHAYNRAGIPKDLEVAAIKVSQRYELCQNLRGSIDFTDDSAGITQLLTNFAVLPRELRVSLARAVRSRGQRSECRSLLEECATHDLVTEGATFVASSTEPLLCSRDVVQPLATLVRLGLRNAHEHSPREVGVVAEELLRCGKEGADELLLLARQSLPCFTESTAGSAMFMRVLGQVAKIKSQRANEFLAEALVAPGLDPRRAKVIITSLVENGYLDQSTSSWLRERDDTRRNTGIAPGDRRQLSLRDVSGVVQALRLGVTPSADVMVYLADPTSEVGQPLAVERFAERISALERYEEQFKAAKTHSELVVSLHESDERRRAFYLLRSGRDRFDLVNNYTFEQFTRMIETIYHLAEHPEPVQRFKEVLIERGHSPEVATTVMKNLSVGAFPLAVAGTNRAPSLFRLDVSNSDVVNNANREIGTVLGSEQIGSCLKGSLYRLFLKGEVGPEARILSAELDVANSLAARNVVLERVEQSFPTYLDRAVTTLQPAWQKIGAKLPFAVTVRDVLTQRRTTLSCEQLISAIEDQRLSLQRAGQQALLALKGQNPELQKVTTEIGRKERALAGFAKGLERNPALITQMDEIQRDLAQLRIKRIEVLGKGIANRFDHLTEDAKQAALDEESKKLAALGSKDASAVFTCMILETLEEVEITERDAEFIKEVASHLQHPFAMIRQAADLDERGRPKRGEDLALLRYLHKREDLITMVRCADAKACCFTSSNYEMQVAHHTPNRQWVASLTADPLSFCISIERPATSDSVADSRERRQNIGFVFGTFGEIDGVPVLCLNGVYLASGSDVRSVSAVLNQIERDLARPLKIVAILVASQHGGATNGAPEGYSQETNEVTRLRALKSSDGKLETRIYDDFSQSVNTPITVRCWTKWLVD
jgi:hypothetical protein